MQDVDADRRCRATEQRFARASDPQTRPQLELLHPSHLEAVGTLAAGLAHDMNNVLAAIMSFCEVLLDRPQAGDVRAGLEQIVTQAERGAELTRGLLAFSRQGQYRKQVLELDGVIRNAVPLLARTLPRSVEVRTALAAGAARVDGDPDQLAHVLANVALNAADAMAGKGVITIESDVVEVDHEHADRLSLVPGPHARVRIRDTGRGMDEQTCRRAFEPFFTTKPLGNGKGLGLALVWGVARAHRGSVSIESEPGHGTTLTMLLPTTNAPLPRVAKCAGSAAAMANTTVLVVDDEPAVRAGITRVLECAGYTVVAACDGAEALRVFETHQASIGLVLLDMAMPVMGGAECFRELRGRSTVPVLVVTGYAHDEDVQYLAARGAVVLEKPFASAALVVEVMRLLRPSSAELDALRAP